MRRSIQSLSSASTSSSLLNNPSVLYSYLSFPLLPSLSLSSPFSCPFTSKSKSPPKMSSPSSSPSASRPATSFHPADRIAKVSAPTVLHEFTPFAIESKSMNLGQGFPGWSPPKFVTEAAAQSVSQSAPNTDFMIHQYARSQGHLPLTTAIAKRMSVALSHPVSPLTDVCVFNGATEALAAIMLGILNKGDEIVVIEPAFDIYSAIADMAGAVLKSVPLKVVKKDEKSNDEDNAHWTLDMEEFSSAFSPKTRMFLLNTPQNPTGKIFSPSELSTMAKIIQHHPDVITVSDEVYEHLSYAPHQHHRIATVDGMYDRTLTVSSAGKTFSVTGWKIGWCVGPSHLVRKAAISHQWLAFSVATPLQHAIALAMDEADKPYEGKSNFYEWFREDYKKKKMILVNALKECGITPIMPEGGFFIVGDTSKVKIPIEYYDEEKVENNKITRDWAFCRWLTKEIGVAAIPPSAFYQEGTKHQAKNYARFAFCKPDEVLNEAAVRLLKVKNFWKK